MPTALVTNASDFAGPPAVQALVASGFRVLVCDRAFHDPAIWARFSETHSGAELVKAADNATLVDAIWSIAGRVDVVVSNDHYPALHRSIEEATLDDLRKTLEILVVEPYALLKAA